MKIKLDKDNTIFFESTNGMKKTIAKLGKEKELEIDDKEFKEAFKRLCDQS